MRNMLKEDNILNSRFGKKNHFQVLKLVISTSLLIG